MFTSEIVMITFLGHELLHPSALGALNRKIRVSQRNDFMMEGLQNVTQLRNESYLESVPVAETTESHRITGILGYQRSGCKELRNQTFLE